MLSTASARFERFTAAAVAYRCVRASDRIPATHAVTSVGSWQGNQKPTEGT